MKIGSVSIEGKLVLAPMHHVTDIAFRKLCKEYGAALVYTELINVTSIVRGTNATLKRMNVSKDEKPISVQLCGTNEDEFVKAALKSEGDIIDVNLGCPSMDTLGIGAGAALLKRPAKIAKIISALVKNVDKPITAKIRINENYLKIAKLIEENGASAICVHARTPDQGYSGNSDWSKIKDIKEHVNIPVIGNGDVSDGPSAFKMLEDTNCDLVMIGRGAMGNPHIFKEINYFLEEDENTPKQSIKEKIKDFWKYVKYSEEFKLDNFSRIKEHATWFTKGMRDGARLRDGISKSKDMNELRTILA